MFIGILISMFLGFCIGLFVGVVIVGIVIVAEEKGT